MGFDIERLGPGTGAGGVVLAPGEGAEPPVLGEPAVQTEHLSVLYGGMPAIEDVSASFYTGRMSAIIGPNGAGKSTFMKAVVGLVKPSRGRVSVFSTSYRAARARVAYVPQRASVDWEFPANVFDVVVMGLYPGLSPFRFIGNRQRRAVMDALEQVSMAHLAGRQIGQLSGGQQQRVFLARALVQDADLLLLDEPFAGVDAATEAAIVTLLKRLVAEGRTVIAIHHDLTTTRAYFDDVLILSVRMIAAGSVASAFTPEALAKAYPGHPMFFEAGALDHAIACPSHLPVTAHDPR